MDRDETGEHAEGRGRDAGDLAEVVGRAARAYGVLEQRLESAGGVGSVVDLYDRVRTLLGGIDFAELDRVAEEIRRAIEVLLRMDSDVRKLNNLKILVHDEAERVASTRSGELG